jgi:hypothetical protein
MYTNLLHRVVCFVNDRELRELLGYPWHRCITLRIPPCSLKFDPAHLTLLTVFLRRRRKAAYTHVYYLQEHVFVIVSRGYMMVHTEVTPNTEKGPGWWWQPNEASSRSYAWDPIEPGRVRFHRRDVTGQGAGRSAWTTSTDYVEK